MDIVKAGRGLTNTIRNVGRLREIVAIFAKHGFEEFISLGVINMIPNFALPKSKQSLKAELKKEGIDFHQLIGEKLRKCFEEMGPAFIKFGQILSSREDIFDPSFIDEMAKLRDKAKPLNFSDVKAQVEASLGQKVEDVFASIDEAPLGTASIGVVFKATLKDATPVVVKVRRPNIAKIMKTDLSIINFLALQSEKASEELKYLGISRVIKDFSVSLNNELNFNIEGFNCERFKKNLSEHDKDEIFYIPKIYKEYVSDDLLVMEFMDGIPFSNIEKILRHKEAVTHNLELGVKLFLKSMLRDGFFHADLHGGNFFLLENNKIGLIDFGLMGSLSSRSRKNFIAIIYSLTSFNYENLVYEFLDVADYDEIPNVDQLISDVRETLSPFVGLTVQQTDFTVVLGLTIATLKKHRLYLPREWFIVFRAMMTLDGVGRSIGLDLDIYTLLEADIKEIIQESISKEELIEDGIWAAKDILASLRIVPRHLKWFLREWSKNKYAIEVIHKGHEASFLKLTNSIYFFSYLFFSAVFAAIGSSFLLNLDIRSIYDFPIISLIFFGVSVVSLLKGLLASK